MQYLLVDRPVHQPELKLRYAYRARDLVARFQEPQKKWREEVQESLALTSSD
jgi:hypothetical protein